jgi:hypothetical protein
VLAQDWKKLAISARLPNSFACILNESPERWVSVSFWFVKIGFSDLNRNDCDFSLNRPGQTSRFPALWSERSQPDRLSQSRRTCEG